MFVKPLAVGLSLLLAMLASLKFERARLCATLLYRRGNFSVFSPVVANTRIWGQWHKGILAYILCV